MRTIILAAGTSSRMGTQKLLLPFGTSTVLGTVISSLRGAGMAPMICAASSEVARECRELDARDVKVVINPRPADGMASSLRIALCEIDPSEPFAIMLGDLPTLSADDIASLEREFDKDGGRTALVPREGIRLGHPSFFPGVWARRLMSASGDSGGRAAIMAHAGEVRFVDAPRACFADLDTPDQYEAARREVG